MDYFLQTMQPPHWPAANPMHSSTQQSIMKTCLLISLLFSSMLCLSSCDYPGYPVGGVGLGAGYYNTLPRGYNSPYYHYNNRYYYGGRYEPGRYNHNGHFYNGRYNHGGHYLYGGNHYGHGHHH
jgi:hypothetical protein